MDEFSTEALKKQIRQNLATRMQRKISLFLAELVWLSNDDFLGPGFESRPKFALCISADEPHRQATNVLVACLCSK